LHSVVLDAGRENTLKSVMSSCSNHTLSYAVDVLGEEGLHSAMRKHVVTQKEGKEMQIMRYS